MAVIETWYRQDLKQPVKVNYLGGNVFSQDNGGNLVGVEVFDDGEPATLSGSVSGAVIRADGATVAISGGTLSGNKCYIILPQSAYAVPGVVSVVLKLTSGATTTTLCAVVANVYRTSTDAIIDPGNIVPSIASLVQAISEAIENIPADYSALTSAIKNVFGIIVPYCVIGTILTNGTDYTSTNRVRTETWLPVGCVFLAKNDVKFTQRYYDANFQFVGVGEWYELSDGQTVQITHDSAVYVRLIVSYIDNSTIANVTEMTDRFALFASDDNYKAWQDEQDARLGTLESEMGTLGDGVSAIEQEVQLSRAEILVNVPNMADAATWTDGAYIAEDGTITQNGFMRYSSLIELTSNQVEYTLCVVPEGEGRIIRVHGYDENGDWYKQITAIHSSLLTPGVPAYVSFVGSDCKYCRISISKEYTALYLGQTVDDKAMKAQLSAYIDSCGATGEVNLLDSVSWTEFGGIGSGGEIDTDGGYKYNHYSDLIPVLKNKRYRIAWICRANRAGGGTYIDGYDDNGDWVKRLRVFPMDEQTSGVPNVGYFNTEGCTNIRITTRSYNFAALSRYDDFEETVTETLYTKTTCSWEDGGLNFLNGSNTTTAGRIRTQTWANLAAEFIRGENVQFTLFVYNRDGAFLGVWNGKKLVTGSVTWFDFLNVREVYNALPDYPNLLFKLTARRPGYDAITPVSGAKVHFYTKIIPYTSVGVYMTWAVCGASSDAGFFNGSNHLNYAWGKILSRMVGNTEYNYATAGQKITDFLNNQGTTGMKQLLEDPAHELYVITLGGNDASDSSITIGTISDISSHSDWHDYGDTMYGNYGRVVSQIMEHAPDAKIILTTPPGINYNARHLAVDNMVREIAAYYEVPYVEWESDEFMRSDVYTKNQVSNHPTKPLYAGKAMAFERLFSRCYAANPGYFA